MTDEAKALYERLVLTLTLYRRSDPGQLGSTVAPVSEPGARVLVDELLALLSTHAGLAQELLGGVTILPRWADCVRTPLQEPEPEPKKPASKKPQPAAA